MSNNRVNSPDVSSPGYHAKEAAVYGTFTGLFGSLAVAGLYEGGVEGVFVGSLTLGLTALMATGAYDHIQYARNAHMSEH